ncbi:Inhibitor of growth proteins N-terminal histone-binding family protein [Cryptosporidium felis]|nr:Inhibitor of growth proteins N-terminal histone-binding family protein [Cryptosporidium felis]
MSDSHELIMDDISLLPGWILRNLSLMREVDKKADDIRIKLENKRSKYLEFSGNAEIKASNSKESTNLNQLCEINDLQKELKALLKEKIAISDQSIHYIRYDGEILRKNYEQLRESLTENYLNNNEPCTAPSNYSGRINLPNQIHLKNSNTSNILHNLTQNPNVNVNDSCDLIPASNENNTTWSSNLQPMESNRCNSPHKTSFGQENPNRQSKRRRSSTSVFIKDTIEHASRGSNNTTDISANLNLNKHDISSEKLNKKSDLCSLCGGSELPNNKIVNCSSCSNSLHTTCCWVISPSMCRTCCKRSSIKLTCTYDIEYYTSHLNTPKSENKVSKNSRKK